MRTLDNRERLKLRPWRSIVGLHLENEVDIDGSANIHRRASGHVWLWPAGSTETGCGSAKVGRGERTAAGKNRSAGFSGRFSKTDDAGLYGDDDRRAAERIGIRRGRESFYRLSSCGNGRAVE